MPEDRPDLSGPAAADLARRLFPTLVGPEPEVAPLPSDRDLNFRIAGQGGTTVLKVYSPSESRDRVQCEDAAVRRLLEREPDFPTPRPRPIEAEGYVGQTLGECDDASGRRCLVRAVDWCDGTLWADRSATPELLRDLGQQLGRLDRALGDFEHPGLREEFPWSLLTAFESSSSLLGNVRDRDRRELLERRLQWFDHRFQRKLEAAPRFAIHNDANDYNLLVTGGLRPNRVAGLLDFGDLMKGPRAAELGVALAYALLDRRDPVADAQRLVAGYHGALPLAEDELALVYPLAVLRLCLSVTMSAYQRSLEPGNEYLSVSEAPAWRLLERLESLPDALFETALRVGCGFDPHPQTAAIDAALARSRHPVLGKPLTSDATVELDFGFGSVLSARPETLDDEIGRALHNGNQSERIGVGLYDEARFWYTTPQFALPQAPGYRGERRTVHLGIDLFAPPGTAVYAPLDGVVESVQNNDEPLDYGPTLILRHEDGSGDEFFTLYGHLASDLLERWSPGDPVSAGTEIARFGEFHENGGWSPHLHLQVMADLLGHRGNFPGVGAPAHRALWRALCPNPVPLTGLEETDAQASEASDSLARRHALMAPSLSISYEEPLEITYGRGDLLYDRDGRSYVDLVNNVCHVGHCHPHVVAAASRQQSTLNTNTRYLSPVRLDYLERLLERLPAPLDTLFLVNSGSEANDLALRLAHTATGTARSVCLDAAYHGHVISTLEVSPYKHDAPGGAGTPGHVVKMPLPDTFRGLYRRAELGSAEAAARYAEDFEERLGAEPVGAFIHESILSCGGQVLLPEGYLQRAYRAVRDRGGVCIADEVQVGFGRVGSHFWAFEMQGVVPDIVTMGKPIGNGHPLAAVATTHAIAQAFDNGMEYFNTFGGNPVSCAVGSAVLDVIEEEALQKRALTLGVRLLRGLEEIAATFPPMADVRGAGLFLGFELAEPETLAPLPGLASEIANQMLHRGFLLSTDGPEHNVIKIKPPLVLTDDHADAVLEALAATCAHCR
ncbi:MAG: aminotransferase class III-fold pyridoxal phosphate-dependent enzyme [Acidobacteriota bacterium]